MGDFGPRCSEVRAGLGPDPSAGRVVPTQVQAGRSSRAQKELDKQNKGFSGTPMWKLQEQCKRAMEEAAQRAALNPEAPQVPDGFVPYQGALYWSEKRQCFWEQGTGRLLVPEPWSGELAELREEGVCTDATLTSSASCQDGPKHARHVVIRDLCKASQALRMPIHHVDRPCSLLALYRGRSGVACADFCAKRMHEKLLKQLSAFRAALADRHLVAILRDTCLAVNAEYLEKHPASEDACSAVVALVVGERLAVAAVGDLAAVLCLRDGSCAELLAASSGGEGDEVAKHFGRGALAAGEVAGAAEAATPEVRVVHLSAEHLGLALLPRDLPAGHAAGAASALQRCAGRPRLAARALAEATGAESGEAAIAVLLDVHAASAASPAAASRSSSSGPAAKRPKTGTTEPRQVRIRHILLKHRDCKNRIDKVRGGRLVARSRTEAERMLAKVLEECESDPKRRAAVFGQRCRELSECPTCLRGGELVGDLAWVARGKMGASFDEVAFALPVGHISDLVDTDAGTHLLLRSA